MNIKQLNKEAIKEDAKTGKAQVRTLTFPKKAKRKDGDDIHKLPDNYPILAEIKSTFDVEYSKTMKDIFLTKLKTIL